MHVKLMSGIFKLAVIAIIAVSTSYVVASDVEVPTAQKQMVMPNLSSMPLTFTENRGQIREETKVNPWFGGMSQSDLPGVCLYPYDYFRLGDCNGDGWCNEGDVIVLVYYLIGGPEPCVSDINGDGGLMGNDVTYLVCWLKGTGPEPSDECDWPVPEVEKGGAIFIDSCVGNPGTTVKVAVSVQCPPIRSFHFSIAYDNENISSIQMSSHNPIFNPDERNWDVGSRIKENVPPDNNDTLNTAVCMFLAGSLSETYPPIEFTELTWVCTLAVTIAEEAPAGFQATPFESDSVMGPPRYFTEYGWQWKDFHPLHDLKTAVGSGWPRTGREFYYFIFYINRGPNAAGDSVDLVLPPEIDYVSSSDDGQYRGLSHTVVWDIDTLTPGGAEILTATLSVPETVPCGTELTTTSRIYPFHSDINQSDNTCVYTTFVRSSMDPNEKHVTPGGSIQVTDTLNYRIDFQNVGNDTAFNIVVVDTLDSDLDISTIEIGFISHFYEFSIEERELTWTFSDINLPDSNVNEPGSHGFVEFSVLPLPDLPEGTIIENRAAIYFDFNPPVYTNTVYNIIGEGCIYTPGDINGDGNVMGNDVTYGVRYFKGLGYPPPDSCQLPDESWLYSAGDVNSSCTFMGNDITFLVAYFKGYNPEILWCPQTPPANPPLMRQGR